MQATVELARRIAGRLGEIEGVVAVALGGSWARGEAHPDSDVDLGIYYRSENPPRITDLRLLARELDDRHPPDAVTDFGEWGPWINGGGWLTIEGRRVDWLYRDLDLIERTVGECSVGRPAVYFQPGHPHGFHTHLHGRGPLLSSAPQPGGRTEVPEECDQELPAPPQACPDPGPALGSPLRARYLPKIGGAGRCLLRRRLPVPVRSLHDSGPLRAERAVPDKRERLRRGYGSSPLRPTNFKGTVNSVLARPGERPEELKSSVGRLENLLKDVEELCAGPLREPNERI